MRRSRFDVPADTPVRWQTVKQLVPYLLEFRARVALALVCLILAKLASIGLPYALKYTVDSLDTDD